MSRTLHTSPPAESREEGNTGKQPTPQPFQNQSQDQTLQDFPKQVKLKGTKFQKHSSKQETQEGSIPE